MSAINFEQSGKRREKRAGTSAGKGAKGEGSYDPTEKGWNL